MRMYSFKGLNLLLTNKQLYGEASKVLLEDNRFVAIIGGQTQVIAQLNAVGVPFWTPPWSDKWDPDWGFFDLGQIKVRPELVISRPIDDAGPPVLLPTELADLAVYAVHRTEPFFGSISTESNPHVEITLNPRKGRISTSWSQDMLDRIGRYVGQVALMAAEDPGEVEIHETYFESGRVLEDTWLASQHLDRAERIKGASEDIAFWVDELEASIAAKNPLQAMSRFQHIALFAAMFFWEWGSVWHCPWDVRTVVQHYARACRWISMLNDPSKFGWRMDFFRKWAVRRLAMVDALLEWPNAWTGLARSECAFTKLRMMELMSPLATCGEFMFKTVAYAGILIAPNHLWGDDCMSYALTMIFDFFRDSRTTLLMCNPWELCRHGPLGKFFNTAEQELQARIVEFLRLELTLRYGPLQFRNRQLNRS